MVSGMELIESLARRLGPYERESASKYKFNCPVCGGAQTLHINPKKDGGPGICIGCGLRTNSVAILHLKGKDAKIAVREKPKVDIDWEDVSRICQFLVDNASLRPVHEKWLSSRGIRSNLSSRPRINSMLVRSSDKAFHLLLDNFPVEKLVRCGFCIMRDGETPRAPGFLTPNRILIPYFDVNAKPVYMRSRYAGSAGTLRYLAPPNLPGSGFSWGWETILPGSEYVIITEGELKAQAAKQLGFPCVALPGMHAGYVSMAESCGAKGVKKAYVIFDTETDTYSNGELKMQGVRASAEALQNTLLEYGIKSVLCELPALNKGKTDLDGFILTRRSESIRDLIMLMISSDRSPVGPP